MALTPNGLSGEIIGALNKINGDNAVSRTMPEIGHAIAKYLTKNTTVLFSWVGIQPGSPPLPDPVVNYTTTKIVGDFACSPTNEKNPILHGIKLGKQITDGIRKFQILPGDGWIVPPGGFLCAPPIILPPYPAKDKSAYWLFQAGIILSFFKLWIKPVPLMGSHGAFLAPPGAGAIMSLIY